ncbi:MAG: caspase family protein [Betaproteobacteria bacterium]|nr:caspase family protein [Betaproteobacteria bacterium]
MTYRALRLGLAVGLLAFPCQALDAAGDTLSPVNTLPRFALVIGNSRYQEMPLRNPGNDANAIAGRLKNMGFTVTLHLDADRRQMLEAIRSFGGSLAQAKGVGLFYFAGHGAQLAWRNYLIPVDAAISTIDEMQSRAVDMNALLDDLIRARNPMNIIILDACRDNPFGSQVTLAQKGLSQLDAPVGTLLAYATAPGNVAADGTGENGLYTEYLLKEIEARDAKIEDVFKRVRMNVRRLSKGQQVPWESTSLEQDFYFIPPAAAKKLTPEELERQFEEELEIWTRIRATRDTAPLEDYLRRFPSGKFSELAQFRLDRLLAQQDEKPVQPGPTSALPSPFRRVAAVHAAESARAAPPGSNPYTKGTGKADWGYRVGDSYTYSRMDAFSRVEANRFKERVTKVTDIEVIYNRGRRITDLLGNDVVGRNGAEFSPSQVFVPEYSIGKKWTTRFHVVRSEERGKGMKKAGRPREDDIEISFRVVAKEPITVPAGTFDAWRVEGHGFLVRGGTTLRYIYWIAPERVRRVLAMEVTGAGKGSKYKRADRFELVAYVQQSGEQAARVASARIQ